jgi:murein DD-endopeptidase MepM/ murein hydrolase activator NlpD
MVLGGPLPPHVKFALGFALLAVVALSAAAGATAPSISSRIQSKQSEVNATQAKLAARRHDLAIARTRESDLQDQLSETNAGIARIGATLDDLSAEVHTSEKRLAWNKVQLDAAQATLARHNDALRGRIVDAYEHGDLGYLNVLLSSTSFSEFVERWDDIRYLVAQTQRTVRERRDAEHAVSGARARLEGEKIRLDEAVSVQQHAEAQMASLADQRRQLLGAATVLRQSVAGQVAQLEDLSASEESSLEALIRERQREEEERRRAIAEAARRAALLAGQAVPPENVGAPGAFSWPVSGPITSPFGLRPNPFGAGMETHPGIDIGAPMGATIAAAAGGRVIFAGWYGGYGNAIILDHGGSTSTLYGHCSQIFVSTGQDVQRGQAIGAVGMTGRATGPHLHFEVRVNGVPVDPTTRLR